MSAHPDETMRLWAAPVDVVTLLLVGWVCYQLVLHTPDTVRWLLLVHRRGKAYRAKLHRHGQPARVRTVTIRRTP